MIEAQTKQLKYKFSELPQLISKIVNIYTSEKAGPLRVIDDGVAILQAPTQSTNHIAGILCGGFKCQLHCRNPCRSDFNICEIKFSNYAWSGLKQSKLKTRKRGCWEFERKVWFSTWMLTDFILAVWNVCFAGVSIPLHRAIHQTVDWMVKVVAPCRQPQSSFRDSVFVFWSGFWWWCFTPPGWVGIKRYIHFYILHLNNKHATVE